MACIAPVHPPAALNELTDIFEACDYVAGHLSRIPGIKGTMKKVAEELLKRECYVLGVVRAKGFTADQVDKILAASGAAAFRPTLEVMWGMTFAPVAQVAAKPTPDPVKHECKIRPTKFLDQGEVCLGQYLAALDMLKDIQLSPRLAEIVTCPSRLTGGDIREVAKEELLYTIKIYSRVNVDALFLGTKAELLTAKYPNLPDGKTWYKILFSKFNNSRKKGAAVRSGPRTNPGRPKRRHKRDQPACVLRQVVGKLPLCDLSPKAVDLIRERGFPVEIDEEAPSLYAAFEGGGEPSGIAVDGALLALTAAALTAADRATPAPPRVNPSPNSTQMPSARTTLGDLASAVSGLRQLGPVATPNSARPEVAAEQENEQQQQAALAAAKGAAEADSSSKKRTSPATGGAANAAPPKKRVAKTKQAAVPEGTVASALEDAAKETDAEVAPPPKFPPRVGLDVLEYDAALLLKDAAIAHWLPDHQEWQVGRITALKYMGHKWAQYPNLPKDRRNKFVEYSHAFREADYGRLWWFVREREPTADELDSFSS